MADAEATGIAIVDEVEPDAVLALVTSDNDFLDTATERAVGTNTGRIAVGEDEGRMRGRRP